MTDLQIYLTLGIFATVILVIALDLLDMTVTALLGSIAVGRAAPRPSPPSSRRAVVSCVHGRNLL